MTNTEILEPDDDQNAISKVLRGTEKRKYGRFVVAALSSIPWVGGAIAASAGLHAESEQGKVNDLIAQWLEYYKNRIAKLERTIEQVAERIDSFGGELAEEVEQRLNDDRYLSLVQRGFRAWDRADSEEKRDYIRRCLTHAAVSRICSDDVVRLFIDWIDRYDEIHFAVIQVLFKNRGATRAFIWEQIHDEDVREDSAEADLFKLLIFDLNTGRVLRQIREKNLHGQFLSKRRQGLQPKSPVLESAFEDTKPYELTDLGEQFVHYVMKEVAPQIGDSSEP